MNSERKRSFRMDVLLLLVAALLGFIWLTQGDALAADVPISLYAGAGSTTLPGSSTPVPVWGYTADGALPTSPGGPTLVVNQGDVVTVNLTNTLAEPTALLFQGQDMIPDTTGVGGGGSKSYTFTASRPGTYLYEAGLLPNAQHQVAMGLYGALVVRPVNGTTPIANQAYASASTAFDEEAVLVLSDIDPALNNNANPAAFDMRNYAPKYFLINGKVYPGTDAIATTAGHNLLLRYVNAGLQAYSMTLLGLRQNAIAMDGSPYGFGRTVVAESIAPGQTADMIVSVPAAAAGDSKFALYDGNLMLHNNKANNAAGGFGGMLTFVTLSGTGTGAGGPAATNVALSPNPTTGTVDVTVTASISDASSGNQNVTAAEFFIDTIGANGSGTAMAGGFGSPTVSVSGTISSVTLGGLSSGNHNVYVHGQDSDGNWGSPNSAVLNLDKTGPATTGLVLTPNPSDGSANVVLSATANDTASGNSNIAARRILHRPGWDTCKWFRYSDSR